MTIETELAQQLSDAQRSGSRTVDQPAFAAIDRAAAYRVQAQVMKNLAASRGMLKLAVAADGSGAAAPIYAKHVGASGKVRVPSANLTGLEVEISRYFVGIEDWGHGADLGGADIELDFDGRRVFGGPARPAFGGVLNSLIAYAAGRHRPYPLTAGTIVTTGSLCGLVPVSGTGKAVAWMGGHQVEVELI